MASRILIVEDDRDLARNLADFLEIQDYVTEHAADGQTALGLLAAKDYDLVVLDLTLPGVDGISLCSHIRNQLRSKMPIVMLTAKDEINTKVSAFDIGADDYIVKPASLREIEARLRALIRRAGMAVDNAVMKVGDLSMDPGTMRIERAGVPITLPPGATKILALLMRRSPNVVHNEALQRELWGEERGESHALVVHMSTLRNAIDKPFDRQMLHTVRGFGYRITHEQSTL